MFQGAHWIVFTPVGGDPFHRQQHPMDASACCPISTTLGMDYHVVKTPTTLVILPLLLITTSNKSLCPFHPTKFPSSIAAASTRHGQEDWAPRHRRPRLGVQVNHKLVPAVGVAKSIQLPVNFILKAKQEVYSYFLLADGVMEITTIEQVLHGNCFLDSIKLVTKLSLHMSLTQQKFFYSFNTTTRQ